MLCRTGGYKRASVTQRGDKNQLVMVISIIHYGDTAQDVCDLNVGLGKSQRLSVGSGRRMKADIIPYRHKDQETNLLLLFMDDVLSPHTRRAITLGNTRISMEATKYAHTSGVQIGKAFHTSSPQQNLHVM